MTFKNPTWRFKFRLSEGSSVTYRLQPYNIASTSSTSARSSLAAAGMSTCPISYLQMGDCYSEVELGRGRMLSNRLDRCPSGSWMWFVKWTCLSQHTYGFHFATMPTATVDEDIRGISGVARQDLVVYGVYHDDSCW